MLLIVCSGFKSCGSFLIHIGVHAVRQAFALHTGEQVGILNIYLRPGGSDRVRDRKGKTVTGRAKSAAVMLAPFDEPTYGLTICEGPETGIALLMAGLSPVWACGGAGLLRWLPVLGGLAFRDGERFPVRAGEMLREQHDLAGVIRIVECAAK